MDDKIVPVNGDRCERCGGPIILVIYSDNTCNVGCRNCESGLCGKPFPYRGGC